MGNILKIGLISVISLLFITDTTFASEVVNAIGSEETGLNVTKAIVTSMVMLILILVIAFETTHRTMATFLAVSVLLGVSHTLGHFYPNLEFLTLNQAFESIDGEVIALLTGMMIIVGVLSDTGLFQWIAYKLYEVSKGNPVKLLFLFILITAGFSGFLDNVTTMFLITPVAISIARILNINPISYIMPMILASNVGGAATLIGDPPNIMIGSYAKLSFNDFLINMGIPMLFIMIILVINMYFVYGKKLKGNGINFAETVKELKEKYKIKHKKLLRVSLFVLFFVIIFFLLHGLFHMPAAVPALVGAGFLMFFRDLIMMKKKHTEDVEEVKHGILKAFEHDIEWAVLGFFVFLFMVVGSLEHSGALTLIADSIKNNFGDNILLCALVILWVSAIASAFLDNIPFTAVMLPITAVLVGNFGEAGTVLWWALAMGACLGGNGTLIGASANIVAVGLMEKEGIHFSFKEFFKIGFPAMLLQIIGATIAIVLMIKL